MFYSFETEERLPRSGILHYHLGEGRFVGPRHDRELHVRRARVPEPARAASRRRPRAPSRTRRRPRAARERRLVRASIVGFCGGLEMLAVCGRHVQSDERQRQRDGRSVRRAESWACCCPGMGAVATTFVAGVEAIRTGLSKPVGSLTQMGTIRLGKRTDNRCPRINEFVPLAPLDDARVRRLGHLRGQRLRGREEGGRAQQRAPGGAEALPGDDQALAGGVRSRST